MAALGPTFRDATMDGSSDPKKCGETRRIRSLFLWRNFFDVILFVILIWYAFEIRVIKLHVEEQHGGGEVVKILKEIKATIEE